MTPRSRLARALTLPTTAVLAVGLFAGCSGDAGAAEEEPTSQSTEAASSGLT